MENDYDKLSQCLELVLLNGMSPDSILWAVVGNLMDTYSAHEVVESLADAIKITLDYEKHVKPAKAESDADG